MGYIASVSKVLQSVEKTGKSQLTIDHAIYFDHRTRMALRVFDEEGKRQIPERSEAEREAIRIHNWMECARSTDEKTSIKTDLAEVTAMMGKVANVREVERAMPRVQFAKVVCVDKLPLGMKYIAANLTSETQAEIEAFSGNYNGWYQRMRTTILADITKELRMSVDQFAICLGLGWSPDVIRFESGLDEKYIVEISETVGKMQLNEVIALMLVFGQQRFVVGQMMILVDLVTECNLEWLFL